MSYELRPKIAAEGSVLVGWEAVARRLAGLVPGGTALVVDSYPGANLTEISSALAAGHDDLLLVDASSLLLAEERRRTLLAPFLTEDRVLGYMCPFRMEDVMDSAAVAAARQKIADHLAGGGRALVIGPGARLVQETGTLVYADMPRWEIQRRYRSGGPGWLASGPESDALKNFKLGYFVEWRIADRWKMQHFEAIDFFLDTTIADAPRLVAAQTMRDALAGVVNRPFRVAPFFDPGVWGGQWMKEKFALPEGPKNYAWGFDCVPEENSLIFDFGGTEVEVPSMNLVLRHPEKLLGPKVYSRFGAEFPIRFDFLDTVKGGNLSLQVHPDTGYARDHFGISYTQDESYYILAAEPGAHVYLGLKDGVKVDDFFAALDLAQTGAAPLDVERYVNKFPAAQHDHFSIPAGTIHCAGDGCVVLEISATPYIFTFKLWDWGRLGLDGLPRPVHSEHGRKVLREDRDTTWAKAEVIDVVETLSDTDGIREERTGLHPLEFIETRRYWFSAPYEQATEGSVHVLNLVSGERATVESPSGAFAPFEVSYAESFIIPAAVGAYRVVPASPGTDHAMVRASVRI